MKRPLLALIAPVVAVASIAVTALPAGAASSDDKKIGKTGLIVAKDLPSSWDSDPADPSSGREVEALASEYAECDDYLTSRKLLKKGVNADSREYTSPDGGTLSNETWVFEKTSAAKRAFAAMSASTNADCFSLTFQQALEDQFAANPAAAGQIADITVAVESVSSLPSSGDDQTGFAGPAVITLVDGTSEQIFVALFGIRTGRGILGYSVAAPLAADGLDSAFTTPAEEAIDATAVRMAKALK